jgi:hypothetical protein
MIETIIFYIRCLVYHGHDLFLALLGVWSVEMVVVENVDVSFISARESRYPPMTCVGILNIPFNNHDSTNPLPSVNCAIDGSTRIL